MAAGTSVWGFSCALRGNPDRMTTTSAARRFPPPPRGRLGAAFFLGRPASLGESIAIRLGTFRDLLRGGRREERRPIALTLLKLTICVALGVVFATASAMVFGTLVARMYAGAVG